MRWDNPAQRWAIANAERYPLSDLLRPFVGSAIQSVESDLEGGIVVSISPSKEAESRFVCQLAHLSGWVVTDAMFSGHCIRFQDPSRFEDLSKDRWLKSTRNERLAPDWDDLSELEDYFDEA